MAEDSVEKPLEQPETKPQAESVEMVRHNGTDKLTKRVRGEKGLFVKQPKTIAKSEDTTRYLRNLLNNAEADANGKITKGAKTRLRIMFDNAIKNACMDAERPVFNKMGELVLDEEGRPVTAVDPKVMMASAQNLKEVMLRAYGTPSRSDEEINAQKLQSVKIVIMQHPEMMDKTVVEDKPHDAPVPAFIDAEIIENE